MISPDELADGVGLITCNPDNCSLRMIRRSTFQDNPYCLGQCQKRLGSVQKPSRSPAGTPGLVREKAVFDLQQRNPVMQLEKMPDHPRENVPAGQALSVIEVELKKAGRLQ